MTQTESAIRFYGLADYRLSGSKLGEVIEFYLSREDADQALREVLDDEPEWEGELDIVQVDLLRLSSQ